MDASESTIEIFGIHLTGAEAFAASLVSLCQSAFACLGWIRAKLIPIQMEVFAWDSKTDPGNESATQLRIHVRNSTRQEQRLTRFEVRYDPGWWKRRRLRWHLEALAAPATDLSDNLPLLPAAGWSSFYPVAIHRKSEDLSPLIVIAGFSRKRVRAASAKKQSTPIRVPAAAAKGDV